MQRYNSFLVSMAALLALICSTSPASAESDVCSRGLGEPPFLSLGVDANLLLLLDNSGSMLDMAYINDTPIAAEQTQCFDNTFTSFNATDANPSVYAGNYNRLIPVAPPAVASETAWYNWVDGLEPWKPGTVYVADALVQANGVVYRAFTVTGNPSSGKSILSDTAVLWEQLLMPNWRPGTAYRAETFVVSPATGNVFYTEAGGTSSATTTSLSPETDTVITWELVETWTTGKVYNTVPTFVLWKNTIYRADIAGTSAGNAPVNDTGVAWVEVDPLAWRADVVYALGDIVTYSGMIYKKLLPAHTSTSLPLDTLYEGSFSTAWERIDEGYYEMVNAAAAQAVCDTAATLAGTTKYSSSDLCITIDNTSDPDRVTAFAATGNMLNWLMASKFDIQKTILTGGKYNSDAQRLISENRGCSGSRFIKQVAVQNALVTYQLTMAVRGPRIEGNPIQKDRVDSSDDTTRVEVLAVTSAGYDPTACQNAINRILSHGLNGSQNEVDACLQGISTDDAAAKARDALNHALQYCWMDHDRNLNTIVSDCEDVYQDLAAGDIPSYHQAYNCSGLYRPNTPHNERPGYIGRCWSPVSGGSTSSTCDDTILPNTTDCGSTYPCVFQYFEPAPSTVKHLLRNTISNKGVVTTERCTTWSGEGTTCPKIVGKDWATFYTLSASGALCDPTTYTPPGDETASAFWSSEIDGDPTTTLDPYDVERFSNPPSKLPSSQAFACVGTAMDDFCSSLKVPQVIDPTDQETSTSGDYGNIPGQLVDSGVLNKLGVDEPLKVMKGYAKQDTSPVGILQKNAEDLRIGAMAFNKVGAWTECQLTNTNDKIERYCPATNQDGAQVIAPVRSGKLLTDDQVGTLNDRFHVDDVAEAVNLVRATAWTPLAEAMYNAIGYFTQNPLVRLNPGDFQTDKDVIAWQNGKIYTPGSYVFDGEVLYQTVLGGTSTGVVGEASRSGDTGVTWEIVGKYAGAWTNNTVYVANAIVRHGGKLYFTVAGGTTKLKPEAALAGRSGPHFDENVIWEPLLDPVVYSCQENHILVITEGASTADINAAIPTFIANKQIVDPSIDTQGQCTDGLLGSTYLDDLTYFARDQKDEFDVYPADNATLPLSDSPFTEQEKNNLTTHIVVAGSLRDSGSLTDECNPAVLMNNAAANGGTETPVLGESPAQLEQQLTEIFNELRQRASAGSAASVISSARGGEGAIYQAIFWPELVRQDAQGKDWKISWAGDVHGLFLDEFGSMYEDTDFDRAMKPSEDLDNDGHFDGGECTIVAGKVVCSDVNNDGTISKTEDLNGDGIFNPGEDLDGDGHFDNVHEDVDDSETWENTGDRRVIIYFDKDKQKSRACYNTSILQTLGVNCTNAVDLEQVRFLWAANDWLSDYPVNSSGARLLSPLLTDTNRTTYISNERRRYIFSWNDLNNDGVVQDNEILNLEKKATVTEWGTLIKDFDAANGYEVNNIVSWLRGKDWLVDEDLNNNKVWDAGEIDADTTDGPTPRRPYRSRQSIIPGTDNIFTWRLGDIIHSTPQTVAAPAEGFHLLYNDATYAQFVAKYKKRRHVVYFGANDGMLHAVNAGFFSDIEKKFCLEAPQANGTCAANDGTNPVPALGAELWAYVPYNLQPHLKCLTSPLYSHKYFVDLKPRVFDAQIFKPDADHPFGWGTILVGGLRFGGAPISAAEINPSDTTERQFVSSYFIMDITNPEKKPVLLGELTQELDASSQPLHVDLGYSTVIPTMVITKTGTTTTTGAVNKWYLIFGSGPHGVNGLKGVSDQQARISVLPLGGVVNTTLTDPFSGTLVDGFVGVDNGNKPVKSMRIPQGLPTASDPSGTFLLPGILPSPNPFPDTAKAFVSDPITIDFDINPASSGQFVSDAVYFGTVEGDFATYAEGNTYWKGGGHLYRLVMNETEHQIGKDDLFTPDVWKIKPLIDLSSRVDSNEPDGFTSWPITAAPSVGTDGHWYWIYFGTGRFFDPDDKTDRHQQSFYGIKEPMTTATVSGKIVKKLTWDEVEIIGTSPTTIGAKGLLQVDAILAQEDSSGSSPLVCRDNTTGGLSATTACLPAATIDTFDELELFIAGTGGCNATTPNDNCVDGWYRKFYPYKNRERNIGQATLLGGLVTFTTYQPFEDVCRAEGNSFLYATYYKTGTSWYENVFGSYGLDRYGEEDYVRNKLDLGRGLTSTPNLFVGSGEEGVKAFVQTSTGEIKEIKQENLPEQNYKTGRERWKEFSRP